MNLKRQAMYLKLIQFMVLILPLSRIKSRISKIFEFPMCCSADDNFKLVGSITFTFSQFSNADARRWHTWRIRRADEETCRHGAKRVDHENSLQPVQSRVDNS